MKLLLTRRLFRRLKEAGQLKMDTVSLNAICPYYTMYPVSFPLGVLSRGGSEGDVVLDPFCGRGTTNYAARILSMPSYGFDSSPVAIALAQAKLAKCTPRSVVRRLSDILSDSRTPTVPSGEFWDWCFHNGTLIQLCKLREALLISSNTQTDVLLRAIAMGALHGPTPKSKPSYFSNQAPRTFSPKPRYSVNFWKARQLKPPLVDLEDVIATRAERYLREIPARIGGKAILADSRCEKSFKNCPTPRWIITSPPYYGMRTYIQDQWLRNWFLGGEDHVEYRSLPTQLAHSGAVHFADQLRIVWTNLAGISDENTRLVIRYGGINTRRADPMEILKLSLGRSGWRILTCRLIPDADAGRRQARQFQTDARKCVQEYDVYCRLS